MPLSARGTRIPYVLATDDDRHLIKVACSHAIVALVEDRRRYWQTLQYLSGVHEAQLTALHRTDLEALRTMYEAATEQRESSLDDIARAMSELASSSRAPAGAGPGAGAGFGAPGGAPAAAAPPGPAASSVAVVDAPVYLDPADIPLCNDCGTCYQELPQFFERTTMIIDGEARQVAHMIPGALESVEVTPQIASRISRVRKSCDAEIIR
jgi:pyruvate-ferredoxin/flavodoxin oxidoreductase